MKWYMKKFISPRKSENGFNLCNNKNYQKKQKIDTIKKLVNGKSAYIVVSSPDSPRCKSC